MATEPKRVEVINPDGERGSIPLDALQEAIGEGFQVVSKKQLAGERNEERFGQGLGSAAGALTLGLASGALMPSLASRFLIGANLMDESAINELRKRRGTLTGLGEIGGFAGSLIGSGPLKGAVTAAAARAGVKNAALVGKAASLALQGPAITAAGRVTQRGVEKALAKAIAAGGKKAGGAKFAARVAGAGTEGMLLGAGHLLDEQALGNFDLTAEEALAHVGMSGLFAGATVPAFAALGAGFRGAGKLMGGARKAIPRGKPFLSREALVEKLRDVTDEKTVSLLLGSDKQAFVDLVKAGSDEKILNLIKKYELFGTDLKTAPSSFVKVIDRVKGVVGKLSKKFTRWNQDLDSLHQAHTAGMKNRGLMRLDASGRLSGRAIDALDEASDFVVGPAVARELSQTVLASAIKEGAPATIQRSIRKIIKRLAKQGPTPMRFEEAIRLRRQAQREILAYKDTFGTPRALHKSEIPLAEMATRINAVIDGKVARLAGVNKKLRLPLKEYIQTRRELSTSINILESGQNQIAAARATGSRQMLANTIGIGAGALAFALTGYWPFGLGAAFAGRQLSSFGAERLLFRMPVLAEKAAALGAVAKSANTTRTRVATAVNKFTQLSGKRPKGLVPAASVIIFRPTVGKNREEIQQDQMQRMQTLASDPAAAMASLEAQLAPLTSAAPNVAAAIKDRFARGLQVASNAAPKRSIREGSLQPDKEPVRVAPSALGRFTRTLEAINNPTSVIDRLGDGTITREGVEVLRQVYPHLFREIQTQLLEAVTTMKQRLNAEDRRLLSLFFGVPLDPSIMPQNVARLQAVHATRRNADEENAAEAAQQVRGRQIKFGKAAQTTAQRIEAR